jgi:hypothetical protein
MPAPTIVGTPVANRYGDLTATTPSGTDFLIGGAGYAPGGVDPSPTATWNGEAMTLIGQDPTGSGSFSVQALFGLVAPDIGTLAYAIGGTGPANRAVMAMQGVDSISPYGTPAGNTGTSDSPSVTCDTGTDAIAVAAVRFSGGGTTITAGTDETVRVQYTEDGGGIAILTKARTGATTTFAPTLSGSVGWNIIAVGVNGAAEPPPPAEPRLVVEFFRP